MQDASTEIMGRFLVRAYNLAGRVGNTLDSPSEEPKQKMFLRICRKSTFRIAAVLAALVLCAVLVSAPSSPFTEKDKAYYADPNMVNFVRPGLQFKILSAEIATDGTIRARFRVTDPRGFAPRQTRRYDARHCLFF